MQTLGVINIGIIGLGYAGQLHSRVLEIMDIDVTYYVYNVELQVAKEFEKTHKCNAVDSLEEMYDKVDAVIIAAPTFAHYDLTMQAMKKGKHILCEKPMALHVGEAEKMLSLCNKKNLVCTVGFNYRFFPITEIFKQKNIPNEIQDIQIIIKRLFRKDWHNKENGVLSDLGIHLIDYLYYLCHQSINLHTCTVNMKCVENWDYETTVCGQLLNGINFKLIASRTEFPEEVQFSFTVKGKNSIFQYDSRKKDVYLIEENNLSNTFIFDKSKKKEDFFDFTESILKQDSEWIKAIINGSTSKIATFEDGLRAQNALNYFLSTKKIKENY